MVVHLRLFRHGDRRVAVPEESDVRGRPEGIDSDDYGDPPPPFCRKFSCPPFRISKNPRFLAKKAKISLRGAFGAAKFPKILGFERFFPQKSENGFFFFGFLHQKTQNFSFGPPSAARKEKA